MLVLQRVVYELILFKPGLEAINCCEQGLYEKKLVVLFLLLTRKKINQITIFAKETILFQKLKEHRFTKSS